MAGYKPTPIRERLINKAVFMPSGCIETTFCVDRSGYPKLRIRGGWGHGHRLSYQEFVAPIPDGLWVLHTCDNKKCINPRHLYLGGALENNRDKYLRGVGCRPTTWEQVRAIRRMRREGATCRDISRATGKSKSSVEAICAGRSWHE